MRLHAENPELSYEEVMELAMRGTPRQVSQSEDKFDFTCYKCGDTYWVDKATHEWIQSLERSPKCSRCYL